MSVNRVAISGNLTRDPELRSTQSGMHILNFGIAVNDRRRNNATGEWEDYANFIDCVLFGNRAEWLARDLHKGKKVFVEGKLRYSSWERDGQRRSKIEVVADEVDYDRPPRAQGGFTQQNSYGNQQAQPSGPFNAATPAPSPAQNPQPQSYDQQPPSQYQPQTSGPQTQGPSVTAPPQADVYDEDIPF